VLRRLLILLLFGLVIAGGAVIAWQDKGQARLVEGDLTAARNLLARTGGFQAGRLEQRLDLIGQAEAQHGAPTRTSLLKASNGLLVLKGALDRDLERVRAAPITFTERVAGTSKMHRRIVLEALVRVTGWALTGGRNRFRVHHELSVAVR
jgi:hypothetical protein